MCGTLRLFHGTVDSRLLTKVKTKCFLTNIKMSLHIDLAANKFVLSVGVTGKAGDLWMSLSAPPASTGRACGHVWRAKLVAVHCRLKFVLISPYGARSLSCMRFFQFSSVIFQVNFMFSPFLFGLIDLLQYIIAYNILFSSIVCSFHFIQLVHTKALSAAVFCPCPELFRPSERKIK